MKGAVWLNLCGVKTICSGGRIGAWRCFTLKRSAGTSLPHAATRALAATPTDNVRDRRYAQGFRGLGRPGLVKMGRLRSSDRAGPMSVTVAVSHARLIVQAKSSGSRYSREHIERLITLARDQLSLLMSDRRCTHMSDGAGARRRDDGYSR